MEAVLCSLKNPSEANQQKKDFFSLIMSASHLNFLLNWTSTASMGGQSKLTRNHTIALLQPPMPLVMWHIRAMDKEIVKAMATKFSEIFAKSMLKKHRKFCRRGLTHMGATPTFKNRSDTYETPCKHFFTK